MDRPAGKVRPQTLHSHPLHPESLMMGYGYDPRLSEGALKCPLFQTSAFVFRTAQEGRSFFEVVYGLREKAPDEETGLIYSRINNPDLQILEDRLTLWEGAEAALAFSSGMAAVSTTLLTFLRPGDTLLWSDPVYGATDYLIQNVLPGMGICTRSFSESSGARSLDDAVQGADSGSPIGAIYVETPAGPTNQLVDIARCAAAARRIGQATGRTPLVVVDNTLLGPLWQRPLDHGADLVLYSLTNCVGGHDDLVAGAAVGAEPQLAAVRNLRTVFGSVADPHTAWLVLRSLETLKLRMTAAMKNAQQLADFLNDHPRVTRVHHLGFLRYGDPQYDVYRRQCKAPGSTFSFEIQGGEPEAYRLLDRLQLIKLGISLGGTESLIQHPATMTHADLTPERRAELGLSPGLLRLSVGIEHPEDLIADLSQALDGV